jgi:tetratricopeptide (TPR) repeat protein
MLKTAIRSFIIVFALAGYGGAQPVADSSGARSFAEFLLARGEFFRAQTEFYRDLFTRPAGDDARIELQYYIAYCQYKRERYAEALATLELVLAARPGPGLESRALLLQALGLLCRGRLEGSRAVLAGLPGDTAYFFTGVNWMLAGRPDSARPRLLNFNLQYPGSGLSPLVAGCSGLLMYRDRDRPKSYPLAVGLGLVPGLGHIYAGRPGDGAFSLIMVGALSAITWFYADHQQWPRAALSGAFGAWFYGSSIYGAASAAKIYNRNRDQMVKVRVTAMLQKNGLLGKLEWAF